MLSFPVEIYTLGGAACLIVTIHGSWPWRGGQPGSAAWAGAESSQFVSRCDHRSCEERVVLGPCHLACAAGG